MLSLTISSCTMIVFTQKPLIISSKEYYDNNRCLYKFNDVFGFVDDAKCFDVGDTVYFIKKNNFN